MSIPSTDIGRVVHCEDAISWLERSEMLQGCSIVSSLPDISEFPGYSLTDWQSWFIKTVALILSRLPDDGVAVFYQSDIKQDGVWIDKGYLCEKAAEVSCHKLLWHKIACRVQPGQPTFGRPGYSHILCFSKGVRLVPGTSSADVIPELGEKVWERGMGLNASLLIANFINEQTATRTVVNPFCGQGSMLAAANCVGLSAIGIERSSKRAEIARLLYLNNDSKKWVINSN